MKTLTTAETIVKMSKSNVAAVKTCAELSTQEINDYAEETTTFIFSDDSAILSTPSELTAHFNQESISFVSNAQKTQAQIDHELAAMFS